LSDGRRVNRRPSIFMGKLKRDFYSAPTLILAREILGKYLTHRTKDGFLSGRIVETEAYIGSDDQASHARFGYTPRSRLMFGPPGYAYIYFIYGMYHCLNVVTEQPGMPAAVLIRALEPVDGLEIMMRRRGRRSDLTNGPGRLCRALGIDGSLNGIDLCGDELYIEDRGGKMREIISSPRVGVSGGKGKHWRFYIKGNRWISRR
jgi:DNA-3-methyladenine glycosylase